jgi:hypothetical protein
LFFALKTGRLKNLFIAITFFFIPVAYPLITFAQPFSYVYIQGDKVTPFYVKMEGVMMPRYGKNYCILSELAPGPIHIEVLFQQHSFAPRKFTIMVPENGYRGFLLSRQENDFVLYDLQLKRYLAPNEQ